MILFSGWSSESCAEIHHCNIGVVFLYTNISLLTHLLLSFSKKEGVGGQKSEDN